MDELTRQILNDVMTAFRSAADAAIPPYRLNLNSGGRNEVSRSAELSGLMGPVPEGTDWQEGIQNGLGNRTFMALSFNDNEESGIFREDELLAELPRQYQ